MIRCDGAPDIGLGHVVRCIALAGELRDEKCDVRFLIRRGPVAVQMTEAAGFSVEQPKNETDRDWISRAIAEHNAGALVMDFRDGLSPEAVRQWRRQGVLTATIDDPEEKRLACDLVFSPPVPQVRRCSWEGFTGELHAGWGWVLLRKQFAGVKRPSGTNARPVVLVTMGGSDPAGLTLKAVQALDALEDDFETIIILGGAFCHDGELEKILREARRRFEIRRNVSNMAEVMARADLAVASFCVTAYELAAVGVPGIYLCLSEDHAQSATEFTTSGMGISLGVYTHVSQASLVQAVRSLLGDPEARREMSSRCRQFADGRGAQRVARLLAERIQAAA